MREVQSSLYSQIIPRATLTPSFSVSHTIISRDLELLNILQKFPFVYNFNNIIQKRGVRKGGYISGLVMCKHCRRCEMNTLRIQGPSTLVRFWRVLWSGACPDFPSKIKDNLCFKSLISPTTKKGAQFLAGIFRFWSQDTPHLEYCFVPFTMWHGKFTFWFELWAGKGPATHLRHGVISPTAWAMWPRKLYNSQGICGDKGCDPLVEFREIPNKRTTQTPTILEEIPIIYNKELYTTLKKYLPECYKVLVQES